MTKTSKEEDRKMSRFLCNDVSSEAGKSELQNSVERIINQNKKVFDNLAKIKSEIT